MKHKFSLSDWLWVFYPVAAIVIMIAGTNYVLTSGPTSLAQMTVDQEQIEADKLREERLEAKLEKLKTVNAEEGRKQLEKMLEAMPAAKQVWMLVNELKIIEVESAMRLDSFKGSVGDVQEATESGKTATESAVAVAEIKEMMLTAIYTTLGIDGVAKAMETAEALSPLVKVVKVDFSLEPTQQVEIIVEGAWAPWQEASNDPELDLVYNPAQISRTLSDLEKFRKADLGLVFGPGEPAEELTED